MCSICKSCLDHSVRYGSKVPVMRKPCVSGIATVAASLVVLTACGGSNLGQDDAQAALSICFASLQTQAHVSVNQLKAAHPHAAIAANPAGSPANYQTIKVTAELNNVSPSCTVGGTRGEPWNWTRLSPSAEPEPPIVAPSNLATPLPSRLTEIVTSPDVLKFSSATFKGGMVTADVSKAANGIAVRFTNLPSLPDGGVYEAFAARGPGQMTPVGLGNGGSPSFVVDLAGPPVEAIIVTLEPPGGATEPNNIVVAVLNLNRPPGN